VVEKDAKSGKNAVANNAKEIITVKQQLEKAKERVIEL